MSATQFDLPNRQPCQTAISRPRIRTVNVLEFAPANPGRVDRVAGVIRGVRILGPTSRNGGHYLPDAIRRARTQYENARVFEGHPRRADDERRPSEQLGWLQNVIESDGGLRGDFHVIMSHPMANQVFEWAERNPSRLGFSHNIEAAESYWDGKRYYTNINRVRSVDLVCDGATTRGIFESFRGVDKMSDSETTIGFFDLFAAKAREVFDAEDIDQAQKPAAIGRLAKLIFAAEESMAADATDASDDEAEDDATGSGDAPTSTPATESFRPVDRRQLPPRQDQAAAFAEADAILAGNRPAHAGGRAMVRRNVLETRMRKSSIDHNEAFLAADEILNGRKPMTAAERASLRVLRQAADRHVFK